MIPSARPRTVLGGSALTFLLAGSHAANDAFANVLPVFLPTLQARFGLGEAVLAAFVALISFSSNVLQPVAGAVADRWGRRRSAAAGLIVGSVLMSLLPVVSSVTALFLLLAIGGLGSALFHPAATSMARAVAGRRKGLAIGLFGSGGPAGSAIMPVVALWLLRSYGPWAIPWLSLIGVAFGIALWARVPRQERPERHARPKLLDLELLRGPVGILAGVGILRAVAYISFLNAMPLFLVNVRGLAPDAGALGWTLAVYQIAAAAGLITAGALEPRLGRTPIVVGAMLLAFPLLLATLFLPPGGVAFYLAVAAAGLATNAPIPLLVVSAQDLAPHAVATASGMLMGFTWGVAGVAYVGFGALQQAVGLVPAMSLAFAFLLPSAALAARVLRRERAALG